MNKKTIAILAIIIFLVILAFGIYYLNNAQQCRNGCTERLLQKAEELKEKMYTKIMPKEAKETLKQDANVILLDVRTKQEYEEGHIKGSILIPLNDLEKEVEEKIENKEQEIIVYCRSGVRSKEAAMLLINKGYQNVKDMGGIIDWPYEIEKE